MKLHWRLPEQAGANLWQVASWSERFSRWVEPRGLADPVERRSARTLATLTLILVGAAVVAIPIELWSVPHFEQRALVVAMGSVVLLAAFVLARSGRWRLGGALAAAVPLLGVTAVLLIEPQDEVAPFAVLLGVVIACVFLRPRHAGYLSLGVCAWLTGLLIWLDRPRPTTTATIVLLGLLSVSLVWASAWRASVAESSRVATQEEERRRAEAQRLEAIGRLAGGIAHDFNNLLAVVQVNASLMGERLHPDDRPALEDLHAAVQHGAGLVSSLLAFAKKGPSEPELVDLGASLEEVVKLLRRLLGRQTTISLQVEGQPRVFMPPMRLRQLVMNLVLNARDAMPKGGSIVIRAGEAAGVWLSVADTGAGMEPAVAQRIFEPFFSTRQQGSGIGLTVVQDVVVAAGGHIDLQTAPGQGATFTIHLPRPKLVTAAPAAGT
jgi:signal transduction histidine kinase